MSLDVGEIECKFFFKGWDNEQILLRLGNIANMHAEKIYLLSCSFFLKFLILFKESLCSLDDLSLVDSPKIFKVVYDG